MTPYERLRLAYDQPTPYEDRFVALVDVLGWSHLITSHEPRDAVPPFASEAAEAISMIREVAVESTAAAAEKDPEVDLDLRASNFSDTFVISAPATEAGLVGLMANLAPLCQRLYYAKRYTRGAVVRGLVRHTRDVLFGPAVVEAHQLENCVAKYPRILMTSAVQEVCQPKSKIHEDFDGMFYLDLFSTVHPFAVPITFLREVLVTVRGNIERDRTKPDLMAKHHWLRKRLETALALSAGGTG